MKKIETYLPFFQGFYCTEFDSENAEEMQMYNFEEDGIEVDYDNVKWDWKEYRDRVAEDCIRSVQSFLESEDLGIKVVFESLYSPREYNFGNDIVYCYFDVNDNDFDTLVTFAKENRSEFDDFLRENYASYDGFFSFLSDDSRVWFGEYLNENHQKFEKAFAGLLTFYMTQNDYTVEQMLEDTQEERDYIDYKLPANV